MKLRNKKTGEIKDTKELIISEWFKKDWKYLYKQLNWLLNEWEEYKDPKEYWYISTRNYEITRVIIDEGTDFDRVQKDKEIGNYFETYEEAEKTLEKLKAFKRLKDNGFKFQFWTSSSAGEDISFFIDWINVDSKSEIDEDLDLLFGDEQ